MVSKKILGLAIAAAFSSQAFAVVDLNDKDAAGSKVSFAKEAFLSANTITGNDNGTYYKVGGAANAVLDFKVKYGTGIANTQKRFVRIDLGNAIFTANSALASTTTGAGTAVGVLVQGGQNKDNYAILEVTATAAVAQDDVANVNVDELAISSSAGVSITATVYETLTSAVNQTANTALNTKSLGGVFSLVSALKVTNNPATATADVASDFKNFGSGPVLVANLGDLKVEADTAAKLPSTAAVTALTDIIVPATSKVSFTGDFSVGAFKYGVTSFALNAGKTATDGVDLGTAFAATTTVSVTLLGDKVINKGDYVAEVSYTALAGAAFAPAKYSAAFGKIAYNGTTIQVPYVTTFADYAQRIVLVNRGGVDAPYTISFTTEDGNTATAGAAATGTLKKNSTTIIKSTDVVTLAGATRTAATINIRAVSGNIDAATTIVNTTDKSTDTVKLQ